MNKTLVALVILALVVIVGVAYFKSPEVVPIDDDRGEITPLGTYFQNRLIALGVQDIGQPIEGFDADLLIMAFPGLTIADFDQVETVEGHYDLEGRQLTLVRSEGAPITSAERMVSQAGYNTLLENVSHRLALPASTKAQVDELITRLDTDADDGAATSTPTIN